MAMKSEAKKCVFLTGMTGSLGSWFARELLSAGYQIVGLARGSSEEQAGRRVARILSFFGMTDLADQVTVIRGSLPLDVNDQEVIGALRRCSMIVHCAACTSFGAADAQNSYAINVEGVRKVLQWAQRLSLPVVHLSTAYVAGDYRGVMRETDLNVGQDFNNVYELTKFKAEELIRKWSSRTGIPVIILRPSIIVGDSVEGRTISFKTAYTFLRMLEKVHRLTNLFGKVYAGRNGTLRLVGDEKATINIVPVDYCARVGYRIIECGQPNTYHITNPHPPSIADLSCLGYRALDIPDENRRVQLVPPSDFVARPASMLESAIQAAVGSYTKYLGGEPTFNRTHTDALVAEGMPEFPPIDERFLHCVIQYGLSVRWRGWLDE